MNNLKIWGWDKKPRTMLRYLKAGDIFCFKYDESTYYFGRILAIIPKFATISEIFDYTSDEPVITHEIIENAKRICHPVNIDAYSLFDRKLTNKTETGKAIKMTDETSDWRIIGHYENFIPKDADSIFFTYGHPLHKKMDIYRNSTPITAEEAMKLPVFTYLTDYDVSKMIELAKDNPNLIYPQWGKH